MIKMSNQDIPLRRKDDHNDSEAVYIPDQTLKIEGSVVQRRKWIITAVIVALCVILIIIGIVLFKPSPAEPPEPQSTPKTPTTPRTPTTAGKPTTPKPPEEEPKVFKKYAVSSDSRKCSKIGIGLFKEGGNAVDVAIGTMFCLGLTTMQSMGIGGGFIMNIYIHNESKAYTYDAREYAPRNVTANMFEKNINATIHGPLSIAVPGEVRGYWAVHQKFGKLEWRDIVEPTVDMCAAGVFITGHMANAMNAVPQIKNDENLKDILVNKTTGEFYKEGTVIHPQKLCETIRKISLNGGDDFYNGTVSQLLLQDLQDIGSIITPEDLNDYKGKWSDSIEFDLDSHKMYTVPFPGSGLFIGFILNILKGYGITEEDITSIDSETLLYHRITEAFKFSFGQRGKYGDPKFINVTKLESDLRSMDFANKIRARINDSETSNNPLHYDAEYSTKTQDGTSHISILAENGDAVSVTSTINFYFGSAITGKRTGVVFNNAINDFSTPGNVNMYGLSESPANYIDSRKRPLSSMSPTIITDNNGKVILVIGAAGGSKITTAISTAIMRILWLKQDVKQTVYKARFHHQLTPMIFQYETGVLNDVLKGLQEKGHNVSETYNPRGSVITAIYKNETAIYGIADYRKMGDILGF